MSASCLLLLACIDKPSDITTRLTGAEFYAKYLLNVSFMGKSLPSASDRASLLSNQCKLILI